MKVAAALKRPAAERTGWDLSDHCCRFCMGRVLRRERHYRCSGCGQESLVTPNAICGCGLKPIAQTAKRKGEPAAEQITRKQGGFRCGPNPHQSHANPSEIVIFFGDDPLDLRRG